MGVAIWGGARCDSLIVEGPRAPVSSEPERDWHPRIVVLLIDVMQADWAAICVGSPTDTSDRRKRCWAGSGLLRCELRVGPDLSSGEGLGSMVRSG